MKTVPLTVIEEGLAIVTVGGSLSKTTVRVFTVTLLKASVARIVML
jgi:hypothetical protein